MRLLQIRDNGELSLVERMPDSLPPYAILSHTWGNNNEEVTYQDLLNDIGGEKVGYRKLVLCGRQAAQDGFQYFWVDTCCIDKTSSAELSEAINSMYSWYQAAGVCYAYLADVKSKDSLSTSKWFTRGWTLQELLAPQEVVFFGGEWNLLGTRVEMREQLSECTQIPVSMLSQEKLIETFSIAQRMSWAADRRTSRIEDIAYCLMGIFDINMPLIYGEGENAFIRLQEEIMKISDDHSIFAWRSSDKRGGCLATSPASFRNSSNIVQPNSLDTAYDPATVSSKGVHLDVRFIGIGRGRLGYAILNCCIQGNENEKIAIHLRDMSLTMRHMERVKSEDFAQVDFGTFTLSRHPIRRLCIQKMRIKSKWKTKVPGEFCNALPMASAPKRFSQEQMAIGSHHSLLQAVQTGVEDNVWLLLTRQNVDLNEEDDTKQTALSYAVANGKKEIVQMLIDRYDVRVNTQDADGRTPMWWAIENGRSAIVRLLLETGRIDINLMDKKGFTPLSRAVQVGDEVAVKLLLGTGSIDVNLKDNGGWTPLSWAVQIGDKVAVKLLLETGSIDVDLKDNDGRTPLSWAVQVGDEAVVKLLLETDSIDVDLKDNDGRTPLSWAAAAAREIHSVTTEQRVLVVKLLLETGKANVDSRDRDGRTPLSWVAAEEGEEGKEVCKLLVEKMIYNDIHSKDEDKWTPLVEAVHLGDLAVIKLFLEIGKVNITSKERDGSTPLLRAVISGRPAVVKLLLGIVGIDVNVKDKDGRTLLSWAVTTRPHRNNAIVDLLLATAEIDVNLGDKDGWTPLHWAVWVVVGKTYREDSMALMPLLEAVQIDVDPKDKDGRTPLSWAVQAAAAATAEGDAVLVRNNETIYSLLASGNVDVDSKDNEGRTPLSWAAESAGALEVQVREPRHWSSEREDYRKVVIVKLLLKTRKVNVNSIDKYGWTALSWAAAGGDKAKDVCNLLLREMLNSNTKLWGKNVDKSTLFSRAVIAGDEAVVKLLLETGSINVNLRDESGRTLLSRAVLAGNEAIIKLLETSKANVNSKDADGLTPLLGAVITGNEAVVKLLLETGKVDINSKDKDGLTPLSRAMLEGNDAIIELLRKYEVDMNANNWDGRKLLTQAMALIMGGAAES